MNRKLRREVRRRNPHSYPPAQHNRDVAFRKALRRSNSALAYLTTVFRGISAAVVATTAAMIQYGNTAAAAFAEAESSQAKLAATYANYNLLPRSRSLGFDPTDHEDEDS